MKTIFKKALYSYFSLLAAIAWLYPVNAIATVSSHAMVEFTAYPLLSTDATSVKPMVMINSSIDHQLYFKVYNDYTDLDGIEGEELTYKHSVDYYGYFDSYKCYSYNSSATTANSGSGRFEPDFVTGTDKYCDGDTWSGNFLNWATMARMDAIRKILFGGHRRIDSASETVLERTYLPNDAHSWVKHYSSTTTEINKLTPFNTATEVSICNTTVNNDDDVSEDVTDPPLLRIAGGNYSLWAANERWQCRWSEEKTSTNANVPANSGLDAEPSNPTKASVGLGLGDYTVRIKACVTGLIGNENCKLYPGVDDGDENTVDEVYKPIGLFQTYAEKLEFGMMGGTFSKNKSGGTLIKDIRSITDEINADDGTFVSVASFVSDNGPGNNPAQAKGIINALSVYRIIKYRHSDGTYGTGTLGVNNCPWGINTFNDGQCQNWGNPFSEIYLNSVRYLAGEPVSGTFNSNDSNEITGLNTPTGFACPLDDTNYCARLNIINFNSSVISYDSDALDANDGVSAIGSTKTSTELTDAVGDGEGITGNDFFVGELIGGAGTDVDQLCTSKTIASFGNVLGICSEAPRLKGSYRIAGIAHYAHTNDIQANLQDDQNIDTYSVALASATPTITLKVPGSATQTVTLLPACQNTAVGGNCALVDFKIVEPYTEVSGIAQGKLYVNWEDSEQGGDFDQDMWGTIDYEISSSSITITTDTHAKSTDYVMGFGYVINGISDGDGFHAHSGIEGYDFDPDGLGGGLPECDDCRVNDAATSRTYAIGSSSASSLQDPLYYAAKWGGFTDGNSNGIPDVQSEWDEKINATGATGQDGIPDNFFYATNPVELEKALIRVFDDILSKTASGTAAAVVANSREGIGAIYQATYVTSRDIKNSDGTTDSVKWYGQLHSFWIDSFGFMREDSNANAILDDYQTDLAIDLIYSEVDRKTTLTRYSSCSETRFILDDGDGCTISPSINNDLSTIKPIWNARKQLSAVTDFNTQRTYANAASTGRHILTWIDANNDNVVDVGEMVNFDDSAIDSANYGFFDVATETEADKIVNFIRGEAVSGYRNRLADVDGDNAKEQLVLGDIVNSTPTPVSSPAEAFDLLYNDSSYKTFRSTYRNRRTVVYAGANDGLLHAFNGGYYDKATKSFLTSRTTDSSEIPASTTTVAHPLGAELWAYAPMNLLPHLKWLTAADYTHVYYMDAKPRVFDAKIFADDDVHPGRWGTVLVAGMRFGGGAMTIDTESDGLGAGNNSDGDTADDMTMRSGYVVLDITNPEAAPVLLAEITHPDAGFTTSYPTAFTIRETDDSPNQWYLAFGSGPTNLTTGESDQNGRLYIYDLAAKDFVTGYDPFVLGDADSFIGDPVSVDWDLSYKSDALYFGTAAGTAASPTGKMYKMNINKDPDPNNWGNPQVFYDAGQPALATPTVAVDSREDHWVFWGTGRLFAFDDLTSTGKQFIYGLKDVEDNDSATLSGYTWDLVDVSSAGLSFTDTDSDGLIDTVTCADSTQGCVQVFSDGSMSGIADFDIDNLDADGDTTSDTDAVDSFSKLSYGMLQKDGWKKSLPADGTDPSTRVLSTSALIGQVLFSSTYTPGTNLCDSLGNSDLYGVFFATGTALPPSVLGTIDLDNDPSTPDFVLDHIDIGSGIASSPSIHTGEGVGDSGVTVVTQTGVGAIDRQEAQVKGGVRSGEMSWRQLYQ